MLQIITVTESLVYVHFHILYTLPKSPFHRHVIVPHLDSLNLRLAPFKLRLALTLDRLVLVTPTRTSGVFPHRVHPSEVKGLQAWLGSEDPGADVKVRAQKAVALSRLQVVHAGEHALVLYRPHRNGKV
jgi:hypothetical protein